MEPEKADDFLAQEYFTVQKFTEDFDARTLTIKAWSVTFSAAGLGLAYVQGEPLILFLAATGALVFWIVEAFWKVNQQAYYPRLVEIERHFAGGPPTTPFQITQSWSRTYHERRGYLYALTIMRWPHVALPHLLIIVGGIMLYALHPPQKPADADTPATPPPSEVPR
jgi:hypothetical protein